MPVFKKHVNLEVARGIKVSFKVEVGVTRDGSAEIAARPGTSKAPGAQARARGWRPEERKAGGPNPENFVWIFGSGRTGSTWLSQMMGELEGWSVWFEPWVGELFNPERLRVGERKGQSFVFSPRYKEAWLRSIKNFVLDGAGVRFPEMIRDEYLVIKDPGGSPGAPMLMEALPESRMVLLIRDPRDYVASWVDAHREGGWKASGEGPDDTAERVVRLANRYVQHVGGAKRAYDLHKGGKTLVRYEELRADTMGTMRRLYSELGMAVDDGELARAVEKHAWENIPEGEKGEGKFYRKATPGSWREDLTPEQVRTVERITAPLLEELYPNGKAL